MPSDRVTRSKLKSTKEALDVDSLVVILRSAIGEAVDSRKLKTLVTATVKFGTPDQVLPLTVLSADEVISGGERKALTHAFLRSLEDEQIEMISRRSKEKGPLYRNADAMLARVYGPAPHEAESKQEGRSVAEEVLRTLAGRKGKSASGNEAIDRVLTYVRGSHTLRAVANTLPVVSAAVSEASDAAVKQIQKQKRQKKGRTKQKEAQKEQKEEKEQKFSHFDETKFQTPERQRQARVDAATPESIVTSPESTVNTPGSAERVTRVRTGPGSIQFAPPHASGQVVPPGMTASQLSASLLRGAEVVGDTIQQGADYVTRGISNIAERNPVATAAAAGVASMAAATPAVQLATITPKGGPIDEFKDVPLDDFEAKFPMQSSEAKQFAGEFEAEAELETGAAEAAPEALGVMGTLGELGLGGIGIVGETLRSAPAGLKAIGEVIGGAIKGKPEGYTTLSATTPDKIIRKGSNTMTSLPTEKGKITPNAENEQLVQLALARARKSKAAPRGVLSPQDQSIEKLAPGPAKAVPPHSNRRVPRKQQFKTPDRGLAPQDQFVANQEARLKHAAGVAGHKELAEETAPVSISESPAQVSTAPLTQEEKANDWVAPDSSYTLTDYARDTTPSLGDQASAAMSQNPANPTAATTNPQAAQAPAFNRSNATAPDPTKINTGSLSRAQETTVGRAYSAGYDKEGLYAKGSDLVTSGNKNIDESTPSLRPQFFMSAAADIIPSEYEQVKSDVLFDMFSVVPPGYGLGADNKLFVENERNKYYNYWRKPMYAPRDWDGPEMGIKPAPWQFQPTISDARLNTAFNKIATRLDSIKELINHQQARAVDTLPDDNNALPSSQGLPRKISPFEPTINNYGTMLPTHDPAGVHMNSLGFKHAYNPQRFPRKREHDPNGSIQPLNKRRSLEVVLQ